MADSNNRTEKLLALILISNLKTVTTSEKVYHLSLAGFTNIEIADLLETTAAAVSQSLYERKKKKGKKRNK